MEKPESSHALALFKRFLAERWFGGPDFESWVRQHPEHEAELRRLRDKWLAELGKPGSGTPVPGEMRGHVAGGLLPGEVLAGFRLVKRLGSGASGEVWEAEELALDRRVALKLLRPDLLLDDRAMERFRNEAFAGAHIHHPGVVTVYSMGREHGQPYIAMELVEGGLTLVGWLDKRRKEGGSVKEHCRRALTLALQVAEALSATHAAGVLHRDVKPGNILVTPDEQAKVADFGLARVRAEGGLSRTGDIMGTPAYMSPEQMRGEVHRLDGRTDVFSLGATLYELVTFRRAFQGETYEEIARAILLVDPPRLRSVDASIPRDLEVVVAHALEKHRGDRYPGMHEFAQDLARLLAGEPPMARSTTLAARLRKWAWRHPTACAIGVLGAALLMLASILRTKSTELVVRQHELLLTRAEQAVNAGDLRQAELLVAQADDLVGEDPRGQLLLMVGHAQIGNTAQSEQHLAWARARGFSADPEQLETARDHYAYAIYLRTQRDLARYPEAETHLREALRLDPRLYGVYFALFQLRVAVRDMDEAASALDELLAHVPSGDPFHGILSALRAETAGDHAEALRRLEELRQRPGMDEAQLRELHWHHNAGRVCQNLDQLDRAEGYLRTAIEVDPQDFGSLENLAYCCYKRILAGDRSAEVRERAMDYADRALEQRAWLKVPRLVRAWLYAERFSLEPAGPGANESSNLRAARSELDALAGASGRTVDARISIAEAARQIEWWVLSLELRGADANLPETREKYARVVELNPDDTPAVLQLADCCHRQKRPGAALEPLEATLAKMDDMRWCESRAPDLLAAIVIWHMGCAAGAGDEAAFQRSYPRFVRLLEENARVQKIELLNAAEFLATAPPGMQDCDLAWRLLEDYNLRREFESQEADTIRLIESSCP